MSYDLVVLGSGPGGYAAAFRAADLGLKVALIERHKTLGGVCLNVGCIPSKALLHVAGKIRMTDDPSHGVTFAKPNIDLEAIRQHKQSTVDTLTSNLTLMAEARKVDVFQGEGRFDSTTSIIVKNEADEKKVSFKNAIIAVGSRAIKLPFVPYDDPRVLDSTSALQLERIPEHLLVLGGGIIGLEMATVFQSLGANITIAELGEQIMTGADKDLVRVFEQVNKDRMRFLTKTQVTNIEATPDALNVTLQDKDGERQLAVDAVLVAVGRSPNGKTAGISDIGVTLDEHGFVLTNDKCQTSVPNIFAIGDVTHGPMLAHKASHQGHVAAEVIAGLVFSTARHSLYRLHISRSGVGRVNANRSQKAKHPNQNRCFPMERQWSRHSLRYDSRQNQTYLRQSNRTRFRRWRGGGSCRGAPRRTHPRYRIRRDTGRHSSNHPRSSKPPRNGRTRCRVRSRCHYRFAKSLISKSVCKKRQQHE